MKKSLKKENEENAHQSHSADVICVSDSAAAAPSINNDNDKSHEQRLRSSISEDLFLRCPEVHGNGHFEQNVFIFSRMKLIF